MTDNESRNKTPGTLTSEEVREELRKLKDNLLHVPAALSDMAKAAVGKAEGEASPGQPAPEPQPTSGSPEVAPAPLESPATTSANEMVILARLAAMEQRLEAIEGMVTEIRTKLFSDEP